MYSKTLNYIIMSKKHETRQEAFERLYGKTTLFPDGPEQQVVQNQRESGIFSLIKWIFKFTIFGTWSLEQMRNKEAFMFFTGLFWMSYSILSVFFLHDISDFFQDSGLSKGTAGFITGCITIFFLVQFLRGTAYMGGYHLFNSGIKGSAFSNYYANPGAGAPIHRVGQSSQGSMNYNRKHEAIDEFKGYVDTKMQWMSNSRREEYMRDLFGGGK